MRILKASKYCFEPDCSFARVDGMVIISCKNCCFEWRFPNPFIGSVPMERQMTYISKAKDVHTVHYHDRLYLHGDT